MKQTKITLELKNGERSQISYVKYDDDMVLQFFKDDDGNIVMKEM